MFMSNILTLYSQIIILMHQQHTAFENIVGKGEIALNEQFLLSHNVFYSIRSLNPHLFVFLTSYLYLLLNLKSLKLPNRLRVKTPSPSNWFKRSFSATSHRINPCSLVGNLQDRGSLVRSSSQ